MQTHMPFFEYPEQSATTLASALSVLERMQRSNIKSVA